MFIWPVHAKIYRTKINYTEGKSIRANGPSPLITGICNSYSMHRSKAGSRNTKVLPYPLGAIPITSLPINTAGSP
jgi:hypothetical protein